MLPNALLLKGYIRRLEDIEALTFTDPNEALARCTEAPPDLVWNSWASFEASFISRTSRS
jgi:hypothetical protein